MGILQGRRLLITGVRAESSIAYHVARLAQSEGAEVILSAPPRALAACQQVGATLPTPVRVIELDVNDPAHIDALAALVGGTVHGVLHSIAFAPKDALGAFMDTPVKSVSTTIATSAFSFKELARGMAPILSSDASLVGLSFDPSVAWPSYDWMGVAKAALESVSRYVARELGPSGVRVNVISPGPIPSQAARAIPGFTALEGAFARAPLAWDVSDVARTTVMALSPWLSGVTGEVIHVDGGQHAVGA